MWSGGECEGVWSGEGECGVCGVEVVSVSVWSGEGECGVCRVEKVSVRVCGVEEV